MPHLRVTTSWDDGHIQDMRLANLLRAYQLRGTFYVAPENHEFDAPLRLTNEQVRQLGQDFEIGAHTLTHPRLTQVTNQVAGDEISGSKTRLEDVVGRPVTSFCYPGGAYTATHVSQVAASGFTYARTVDRFAFTTGHNPLTAPTTIHAYRHWSDAARIAAWAQFNPTLSLRYVLNWDALAIAMFTSARQNGGVFHLWGHSWEIERNHDWARLERVLAAISGHSDVSYVTNSELVA